MGQIVSSVDHQLNRRSYMSAPVLLNLLNELNKSDKIQGLQSILSPFHNKFNNTGAQCKTLFIT